MRKSQAILEVTLIFIVGLFLFFGIMGMWMWGDNQIAKRQPEYNETRVAAGTLKKISGSAEGSVLLENLIAQRDGLEDQLASMRTSIEDSTADLETSKALHEAKLNQCKAEKARLEAKRGGLEVEQGDLRKELAELQRTCRGINNCRNKKQAIRDRLGVIRSGIIEINDRVDNFLIPEIDRLQKIIDQIDETIAALENDVMLAEELEEEISELNERIAELESQGESGPEAKDSYWPVYEPEELSEQNVFGVQRR